MEANGNVHLAVPFFDGRQDVMSHYSARTSFLQEPSCSQEIKSTLQELEIVLMSPDDEEVATSDTSVAGSSRQHALNSSEDGHLEKHHKILEEAFLQYSPQNSLKQLLIACAKALSENNISYFDEPVGNARSVVSISGEPIQRLGA